ncbi:MAG TPA: SCO family protein [Thermoanaerobaculia bacterium]|jgi:protein SCO1/2|nr:SCO family protein [Thermoanaerobaculia bacterium]
MKLGRAGTLILAVALPLLFALGCAHSPTFHGQVVEPVLKAPQLSGVNWDGKPFHLSDHGGKVAVVFFGYTYCPDVCPFTLAKMKQLYSRLGVQAKDVDVVFVSVDPQRDTVDKLAQYVPSFDPHFYGVHVEPAALDGVAKGFDLTVQYGTPKEGPEAANNYFVDHTATFFVIDRQGRLRLKFPPGATVNQMLPDIKTLLTI